MQLLDMYSDLEESVLIINGQRTELKNVNNKKKIETLELKSTITEIKNSLEKLTSDRR